MYCNTMSFSVPGIFLIVSLVGVNGGADANIEGVGVRDHHDHLQEEILAAMKDSGVLDEWKEKLDEMLYKEEDVIRRRDRNCLLSTIRRKKC